MDNEDITYVRVPLANGYFGVCNYTLGQCLCSLFLILFPSLGVWGCIIYFDFPRVEKGRCKAGGNIISCIHHQDGSHLGTDSACPARLLPEGANFPLSVNVVKSGSKDLLLYDGEARKAKRT